MRNVLELYAINELHEADRENNLRHRVLLLGILEERRRRRERQNRERKPRSCQQRMWISRRTVLGKFHNLFINYLTIRSLLVCHLHKSHFS